MPDCKHVRTHGGIDTVGVALVLVLVAVLSWAQTSAANRARVVIFANIVLRVRDEM